MMEKWKPVPDYEDLYEISSLGRVRSLCNRYGKNKILKPGVGSRGYLNITLCRKGSQKTVNIHRLVACAFIPNPDNLPCVNHKDENKANNNMSNLEWCSYLYNNTYGHRLASAISRAKSVKCIETGEIFQSQRLASESLGVQQSSISACCYGRQKTAGGLHWTFA